MSKLIYLGRVSKETKGKFISTERDILTDVKIDFCVQGSSVPVGQYYENGPDRGVNQSLVPC
jgi:hypothetical protein